MPSLANSFQPINTGGVRYGVPTGRRSDINWGGAVSGGIEGSRGGGGWLGALGGAIQGALSGGGSEPPQGSPAVPGTTGLVGGSATCPDGSFKVLGRCIDLQPGGAVSGGGMMLGGGEAVLGRYGVAMVPASAQRTRLRCPRGMVLGMDNLCYNRRDLRKDERKWRPGRKPLLTGGELNAISTAMSAAKKLDRQKKRLKATARAFERAS